MENLNDRGIIRDYLFNRLNETQQKEVETRLDIEPEFKEMFLAEKLISLGAIKIADLRSKNALENARQIANDLGDDLFLDVVDDHENIEVDIDVEESYSLEELLAQFQPIDHYEQKIASVQRSTSQGKKKMELLLPKTKSEVIGLLKLQWKTPLETQVRITIIDSEDESIYDEKHEASPQINVNVENLKPGRYYLKVRATDYVMEMRSFFIKKYLLPNS